MKCEENILKQTNYLSTSVALRRLNIAFSYITSVINILITTAKLSFLTLS